MGPLIYVLPRAPDSLKTALIVAQRYNSTTPSLTPSLKLLLTVATVAERGWLGAYVLDMVND